MITITPELFNTARAMQIAGARAALHSLERNPQGIPEFRRQELITEFSNLLESASNATPAPRS